MVAMLPASNDPFLSFLLCHFYMFLKVNIMFPKKAQ
jgi:hypothetical protein